MDGAMRTFKRKLNMRDIADLADVQNETEQGLLVVSRCLGIPMSEVEEMEPAEFKECIEIVTVNNGSGL